MAENTPCPDRILDDMGSAFCMGAIGGGVWHGIKGMKNSPKGYRLRGAAQSIALRSPNLGGGFAVWGGLFSTFDCLYSHLRRKEDPWNAVSAGATTGGILAARAGWKAMGKNALIGGVLLGLIEGLGIMINKMVPSGEQQMGAPPPPPGMSAPPRVGAPPMQSHTMVGSEHSHDPSFVFSDDDFADDDDFAGGDSFAFNDTEDFDEEDW